MIEEVYVIDDDATTCFLLETKLESSKFKLKTFTSSRLFLDTLANLENSFFFLDVNMPSPDGFETTKELIERGVNVSNIFIFTDNSEIKIRFKELHEIQNFILKTDLNISFLEQLLK